MFRIMLTQMLLFLLLNFESFNFWTRYRDEAFKPHRGPVGMLGSIQNNSWVK